MKLIMVSAGFENGGNCLHRHLDGHPNLLVYPFESMLGTPASSNILTPAVPFRYAWPEFNSEETYKSAYHKIYDEEMKTFLRRPSLSKFKDCGAVIDEKDRIESFGNYLLDSPFSRKLYVESYFHSAFKSWRNLTKSGKETHWVGYSPAILMDADKIFSDFPDAKIIHIIRNPWSGYADTLKRPYPQSLERYCQIWNILQLNARVYESKYPDNFEIIHFEDLIVNKEEEMKALSESLEISYDKSLLYPSFNGKKLNSIYPWGTIKEATYDENIKTANELSKDQKDKILEECFYYGALSIGINYEPIINKIF